MLANHNQILWLWLLNKGGLWDTEELSLHLERSRDDLTSALQYMRIKSHVKRADPCPGTKFVRYGVTKECVVPLGITLAEIYA